MDNKLPKNLLSGGFGNGEPIRANELADVRAFIRENFGFSAKINKKAGSYSLKHLVERQIESYVANGNLIAAMILEGFEFERDGINAFFNVDKASIEKFKPRA